MKTTISVLASDTEQVDRVTQWGVRFPDGTINWSNVESNYTPQVSFDGANYHLLPMYDDRRSINTFGELVRKHRKKLENLGVEPTDPVRVSREIVVVYSAATVTEWKEPLK